MKTPDVLARRRKFSPGSAFTTRPSGSNLTVTKTVTCSPYGITVGLERGGALDLLPPEIKTLPRSKRLIHNGSTVAVYGFGSKAALDRNLQLACLL
jgi:hypothetical protein